MALPDGRHLPVAQVLQGAIALHQVGRLRKAAELYQCILAVEPRHPDALHLLGLTERQLGRLPQAIDLLRTAIAANPRAPLFHSNLGEALCAQGAVAEAEVACRRALQLDASLPEAHLNLGSALRQQQRFEAAQAAYAEALRLRPAYVDALLGIGDTLQQTGRLAEALPFFQRILDRQPDNAAGLTRIGINLRMQGRIEEAIAHYEAALARYPAISELHNNVALLYQRVGRLDAAAASLRQLLQRTPDDVSAQHLLAALEGRTTERAPVDYVRDTFDGYAENFESHLVAKLGYHAPEQLAELVKAQWAAGAADKAVLDLGCGTGLFGAAIAGASGRLVGIDIAPKMVEKSREKGVYSDLAVADILPYLQNTPDTSFDLVAATDVFIYLGDLAAIFAETARVLRPGGLFAFSIEAAAEGGADFELDITGRYRQSAAYLHRLATANHLWSAQFSPAVIRHQNDRPVNGYLCVFKAPE